MQELAGLPHTGHQKDGTYVVSEQEEKLACRQIKDRIEVLSREIKMLPAQAAIEQKSEPTTVTAAFGRLFGGEGEGLQAATDFQRATAETEALNALLLRKRCG